MTITPQRPSIAPRQLLSQSAVGREKLVDNLVDVEGGVISARVFSDPSLFDLEVDRIFTTGWMLVGHESEIPNSGDYMLRYLGADWVLVTRDARNAINIMHNSCSHRRMAVCRSDQGNAKIFKCPYHGYTYGSSGDLLSVPTPQQAYGDKLDKSALGLTKARCETYGGLIFGCWDASAPSLDESLGDVRWYLDLMFRRTPGGTEVLGPPQRLRVKANWKIGVENFGGDGYHFNQSHQSTRDIGCVPAFPQFPWYGALVHTKEAHSLGINQVPPDVPFPPFSTIAPELLEIVKKTLNDGQLEVLANTANIHGSVFPNTSYLYSMMVADPDKPPAPFLLIRTWVPISPDETEVITWNIVDREASDEFKQSSSQTYIRSFGTSGIFEQDDFEMFSLITKMASSPIGRRQTMDYSMGLHREPLTDWPGPGTAFQDDMTEASHRMFYKRWVEQLRSGGHTVADEQH